MVRNFNFYNFSYCEAVAFLKADFSNEIHITMKNELYHVFWERECENHIIHVFCDGDWIASFQDCLDSLIYVNNRNHVSML